MWSLSNFTQNTHSGWGRRWTHVVVAVRRFRKNRDHRPGDFILDKLKLIIFLQSQPTDTTVVQSHRTDTNAVDNQSNKVILFIHEMYPQPFI